MLTQYQTTEPQAAILAACPRPRALASFAAVVPAVSLTPASPAASATALVPASRVPGAAWACATAPLAASVRRPGSVAERPQAGYGVNPALSGAERAEVGGSGNGIAGGNGIAMRNDQKNPQHKQHLTTRREPVTWRPPH